jgi:hypothetical protein
MQIKHEQHSNKDINKRNLLLKIFIPISLIVIALSVLLGC